MSTFQWARPSSVSLRGAFARATIVIGVLGALVVAILILGTGSATNPARVHAAIRVAQPAVSVPLIQYRGTGAPPPAHGVHPTSAAPPAAAARAEHSYGAVP